MEGRAWKGGAQSGGTSHAGAKEVPCWLLQRVQGTSQLKYPKSQHWQRFGQPLPVIRSSRLAASQAQMKHDAAQERLVTPGESLDCSIWKD